MKKPSVPGARDISWSIIPKYTAIVASTANRQARTPSGFGEKGPLWLKFTIRTHGAHGAYTHASPSATRIAARLIAALEELEEMAFDYPDNVRTALVEGQEATDTAMGKGASEIPAEGHA